MRKPTGSIMPLNISLSFWLIVSGVVFTTLAGVISGYVPAGKAMESSAIEAIYAE